MTALLTSAPVAILAGDRADAARADDAALLAGFTTWERTADGRRVARSHLRLTGLWCAACSGLIEQALMAQPGVVAASASAASERACVVWDPALTRVSRLIDAVQRAGYGATPDAAAPARAARQAEQRAALWRLFVAVFCMMQVMMYQAPLYIAAPGTLDPDLRSLLLWAAWVLTVPVVLFSAAPMFRGAWAGLRQRRVAMDLPVALAIAITFIVSSAATFAPGSVFGSEPYFDSLTMFVSFLLGSRYLALKLRHRTARGLENALGTMPATARVVAADGSSETLPLHQLQEGDRVRVFAGEAFPADGPLLAGETEADESLLTGESRPVAKRPGDTAIAGSINLRGAVLQRADRVGPDTRYEEIVHLVRSAATARPPLLGVADRIAAPFLAVVLLLAAAAAAVWSTIDPSRAVWVAVSVLVVTCPCALALAAPSTLLAAAGALARRGVLVRRFEALEALASIDTVCFDKTGTLTEARSALVAIERGEAARRDGLDDAGMLALAGALAATSTHPLACALAEAAGAGAGPARAARRIERFTEYPGLGIEALCAGGGVLRLGSAAWATGAVDPVASRGDDLHTWLGDGTEALARFTFGEALRGDARASVERLRAEGVTVELLSGDAQARVDAVGHALAITRARGALTPAAKLDAVASLQREGHRVAMVGDGLNDAPVLARADVSFAIGSAALAQAEADFVLLGGALADVAEARAVARFAMRVVSQNLAWAAVYNAVCVPLALLGLFPPWAAGLGMAASSLVVMLNALRVDRATRSRRSFSGAAS